MSKRLPHHHKDKKTSVVVNARMMKLMQMAMMLQTSKVTVAQIAKRLDMCARSVYRYIDILEAMDIAIEKDFYNKYFIAQDLCPLCGSEVKHG
jgi:predicted AAA+ superfamily ATPase